MTITPNMGIVLMPQASYKIISSSPDCRVEIIYKNINDEYHKQLLAPIIDILNNLKAFKNNCYHLTEEISQIIGEALIPQNNNKIIAEKFGFTDISGLYRYIRTHTEYKNLSQLIASFKIQQ